MLEKTTPGPVGVSTCYREVVQMNPLVKGEIRSTIQRYEPSRFLEESFEGTGMHGYLAYEFIPVEEGTHLIQRETIQFHGLFWFFSPIMGKMLLKAVEARLEKIKSFLEERSDKEDQRRVPYLHIVWDVYQSFQQALTVDQSQWVFLTIHNHHYFASFGDHHLNRFRNGHFY